MTDEIECEFRLFSLTDSHAYNLPDDLFFGQLKSTTDYTQCRELDDGSFSIVYLAKDKQNREFAMKCLKPTERGPGLAKEVFREITILKSLDHENIVKLHEVIMGTFPNFASPRSLCLLLDYYELTLFELMDRYPDGEDITPNQVKGISQQLLRGLNYLHKNFIVHRDITPRNLMISKEGKLKIIDFGLSKRITIPEKAFSGSQIFRWYRAPELLYEAPSYGCEVDIWSAACVMAELFRRKVFIPGDTDFAQLNLIVGLIGTPTTNHWPGLRDCRLYQSFKFNPQPFNNLTDRLTEIGALASADLMSNMFVYDPDKRWTAEQCLADPWFMRAPFPSKQIEIPENSETNEPAFNPKCPKSSTDVNVDVNRGILAKR